MSETNASLLSREWQRGYDTGLSVQKQRIAELEKQLSMMGEDFSKHWKRAEFFEGECERIQERAGEVVAELEAENERHRNEAVEGGRMLGYIALEMGKAQAENERLRKSHEEWASEASEYRRENERLRKAIEAAPCAEMLFGDTERCAEWDTGQCNCWKREALEAARMTDGRLED